MTTTEMTASGLTASGLTSPSFLYLSSHPDGVVRGLAADDRQCWMVVVECIVLIALWALALLGNVLVCLVIQRSRRVQSTTNYFVKSMAYSDIVLVLFNSPAICIRLVQDEWKLGHITCRLVRFSQHSSMACMAFILMAICFDRYYTIIYPLSFKVTRGTAKRLIILSWIVATITSSLSIYVFDEIRGHQFPQTSSNSVRHICPSFIPTHHWAGQIYSCVLVVGLYLCPVLAVASGYFRVIFYIRRTRIKVQIRSSSVIPRNKVKMVQTLFILTITTLLFYSPFFIVQIFHCFNRWTFLSPHIFVAAYAMISLSAALKPVLYACRNRNFWQGCKEMLCMSSMKCYRLNTYTITTASRLGKKNFIGIMDLSREQTHESMSSPNELVGRVDSKNNSPWSLNGASPSTAF